MNLTALPLPGCSPTPLAHYLKALGILRLLSRQLPPEIPRPRGAWRGETFLLHTSLDRAALEHFLLHEYRPTPIVAPWNGGSGFHPGDNREAIDSLMAHPTERFAALREAIAAGRAALDRVGLTGKPDGDRKESLLLACRGAFPTGALEWLDAVLVLTGEGPKYPPLLGTGGNDGRLDFTNNFMQRLTELFDTATGEPADGAAALLSACLFAQPTPGLHDSAIGQFFPHAAGGPNSTTGFDGRALVNPWDFVLMLEGALLFAAAAVRRLGSSDGAQLAFPFSVQASGFGYASAAESDIAARCELWAPLWSQPATLAELAHVLGEGRARIRNRAARDGFDFARAIACLGVDRGLSAFQRYSFAPRNGLAFFATPLDRIPVRRQPAASRFLDELDRQNWFDLTRRAARADRVPARVASAIRQLESSALVLLRSAQHGDEETSAVEALLLAVTDVEDALARSLRWTLKQRLQPLPRLGACWWTALSRRRTPELDLAAGLASLDQPAFRTHWEPVEVSNGMARWAPQSREVLWRDPDLVHSLLDIHQRRLLRDDAATPTPFGRYAVRPGSLVSFLDQETDDLTLARLARALSLVELPPDADRSFPDSGAESFAQQAELLPALFALPRLALAGSAPRTGEPLPRPREILRRGAAGDGQTATQLAAQHLRASGFNPVIRAVPASGPSVPRTFAATLFPLAGPVLHRLADRLGYPTKPT